MLNYPYTRLRRNRKSVWSREICSSIHVNPSDLIYPIFIHDKKENEPIPSLPNQLRLSLDGAVSIASRAYELGMPALALFPVIDPSLKDENGTEALSPNNLMAKAIDTIKTKVPDIGIIADVALDPYTIHGHDGIMDGDGHIANDETVEALCLMALQLAKAGADAVAPSDMMDGRVISIREALEDEGFCNTQIFSYAAKFASNFYGPFRGAVGASPLKGLSDKKSYQLDPRDPRTAIEEIRMDVSEGADMVIIKPGLPYLDIIKEAHQMVNIPMLAYHVSGEYAMLKWAAENGAFNYQDALLETMISFKRAGCSGIITYAAMDLATLI
jgi:porphobilinogen synthase